MLRLRPPTPTGYMCPAEADERIDMRRIIDLLQHPASVRESQLSLSGSVSLGRK